jgi:hypothetical protein
VFGSVNGVPGWFLVDSGSSHTLLDRAFVERHSLGARPYETPLPTTRDGQLVGHLHHHALASVSIDSCRLGQVDAPLVDLRDIPGSPAGLIGQDLLREWVLVFEPDLARVHWCADEHSAKALLEERELRIRGRAPFRWRRGVPVLAWRPGEGDPVDAILDTGSTRCALPLRTLDGLAAEPAGRCRALTITGAITAGAWRVHARGPVGELRELDVIESGSGQGRYGFRAMARGCFALDGPGRSFWSIEGPSTTR